MTYRLFAAAAALLFIAAPVQAQIDIGMTGSNGWQVSCSPINGGVVGSTPCDGSFANVTQVTTGANGWLTGPWFSPVASSSLGQVNRENPRWEFTFRKFMTFNAVQPGEVAQIDVSRMLLDNYFFGVSLNGHSFTPNWMGLAGAPLPPNGSNWTKTFQFSNRVDALVEGQNELQFVIGGNGRTDMFALDGTITRTVPEPGVLLLLFAGMGVLVLAGRRRGIV